MDSMKINKLRDGRMPRRQKYDVHIKNALPAARRRFGAAAKKITGAASREDGAALLMVLTIIFVMSTLGGVALLATLTNLKMSAKYAGWTGEYYALDKTAEAKLGLLDGRLSEAEGYAYEYMRTQSYLIGEDAPAITGDSATDVNKTAQDFIYNTWYAEVYEPSFASSGAGGVEVLDEDRYNSLFIRFSGEIYRRLYYYFSYLLIARDVKNGVFDSIELTPMMAGFAGMRENYAYDPDGMTVVLEVTDGKEAYAKHVTLSVRVIAPIYGYETRTEDIPFTANPIWTSALTARGSIRFENGANPGETSVANPGDNSGASPGAGARAARVYGDVSAIDINEFYFDQNEWASVEGNEYGIASAGAAVEIYGNVYTRGDFHVTGDGGSITVRRYPDGFDAGYRNGLFGNTLYFDTSPVPVMIQRYTQPEDGAWNRNFIPFFYRDHLGGNVYCNNLSVEKNVRDASIAIENGPLPDGGRDGGRDGFTGVVWTFDNVNNKGLNSRISIDGNLIGINSDAVFNDYTSSSAVINTNYENSSIELSGAVIMPGTAYLKFDGVNGITDENAYFETAESITATNTAILNAYMEKPSFDPGTLYYYNRFVLNTERGISNVFLVHYESIGDKARHLINQLAGRAPDTGIVIGDSLEGYTRGVAFAEDGSGNKRMFGPPGFGEIENYREIINYADNYLAYSEIKDSLITAFKQKTESFGSASRKFGDFVNLTAVLDPYGRLYPELEDSITFFTGDSTLELDGDSGGIVYCATGMDGSLPVLTITGNGAFRGTIICEGDIVIKGTPTITYDEKLISKILLYHPEIRDFFSPGEIGETGYVRVTGVAQGIKKLAKERYAVLDWKEWQE